MTHFPDEARWWLPVQGCGPGRLTAPAAIALLQRLAEQTRARAATLGYDITARWPSATAPGSPTDYALVDLTDRPARDPLDDLAAAVGCGADADAVVAAWRAVGDPVVGSLGPAAAIGDWTLAAAIVQELLERSLAVPFRDHLVGLIGAAAAGAVVRQIIAKHLPNAGWSWTIGALLWAIQGRMPHRPLLRLPTPLALPPPRRDAVFDVPGPSAGAWSKRFVVDYKPSPPKWPRWNLDDARAFVERLGLGLLPIEYGCALFGSVLRSGVGNDLDAVVFPIRADERYATRDVLALIEVMTGGTTQLKFVKSANCSQFLLTLPCQRTVDFQVWCIMPYPEEVGPP